MPQAPFPLKYAHIANAGTTVVKAAPGVLGSLNVNSASSAATVQFIDAASTTVATPVIGTITFGAADTLPQNLPLGSTAEGVPGLAVNTGIVVITTGTLDVTIGYR